MKQTIPAPKPHTVLAPGKGPVRETIIKATIIRRPLTTALLLLCAYASFGQRPFYQNTADYALPASEWGLDDIPSIYTLNVWQNSREDGRDLMHYNIDSNYIALRYFNAMIVMTSANSIEVEYNEYTGVTCLHFKVLQDNDCSSSPWTHKMSFYRREKGKLWFITYDSPCDGIVVRTGDSGLLKAIKLKYKAPPVKKPKNYVSKS